MRLTIHLNSGSLTCEELLVHFFFVLLKTQGNIFEYLEIINHYTANNRSDDGNKIQSTLH